MTAEEYQKLVAANAGKTAAAKKVAAVKPAADKPKTGVERWQALGRLRDGELNQTEQEFAALLDAWKQDGKVLWWKAHPFSLKLAKSTHYRVDFLALGSDGYLTMYEVKGGYVSQSGANKIKLAAEAMPVMRMVKATKRPKSDGGGFDLKEF